MTAVGRQYPPTGDGVRPLPESIQVVRRASFFDRGQSFTNWGEVFGDRVIVTAILDRLLHHGITVTIRGDSYRLKEKIKAGLLKGAEATP